MITILVQFPLKATLVGLSMTGHTHICTHAHTVLGQMAAKTAHPVTPRQCGGGLAAEGDPLSGRARQGMGAALCPGPCEGKR